MVTLLEIKRKELGLTQQDIAKKLKVTRISVSKWENFKVKPLMTYDLKVNLSIIFNIPIDNVESLFLPYKQYTLVS